jgi:hypothetical protein
MLNGGVNDYTDRKAGPALACARKSGPNDEEADRAQMATQRPNCNRQVRAAD